MKYEAIIFDLDGTILDTIEDLCDSVNYALAMYELPSITLEQAKTYIGNGIPMLVKRSIGYDHPQFDLILKEMNLRYCVILANKTKPYPGIYDIMDYCKNENIKMAVVSNKKQEPLDILCEKFFSEYIDVVIGDCKTLPRKPNPDSVLEACKRLNVNYENVLYVGDSDVDIKTVNNVGCHGAYVSYGFRKKEVLVENGADNLFDSAYDLLNWLRG